MSPRSACICAWGATAAPLAPLLRRVVVGLRQIPAPRRRARPARCSGRSRALAARRRTRRPWPPPRAPPPPGGAPRSGSRARRLPGSCSAGASLPPARRARAAAHACRRRAPAALRRSEGRGTPRGGRHAPQPTRAAPPTGGAPKRGHPQASLGSRAGCARAARARSCGARDRVLTSGQLKCTASSCLAPSTRFLAAAPRGCWRPRGCLQPRGLLVSVTQGCERGRASAPVRRSGAWAPREDQNHRAVFVEGTYVRRPGPSKALPRCALRRRRRARARARAAMAPPHLTYYSAWFCPFAVRPRAPAARAAPGEQAKDPARGVICCCFRARAGVGSSRRRPPLLSPLPGVCVWR